MSELLPLALSAFVIGILGAGHCLGMCGGLMSALSLGISPQARGRRLSFVLAYNLGRILSYVLAGVLLGLLGWALGNSPAAEFMRILAGLLLIAMGLYLAGWWHGLTYIERIGTKLWQYIQPQTKRYMPVTTLKSALLLGALWGWLPCGLVYSTLLWAASQSEVTTSAVLMLCFGLGTLPILVLSGLAATQLTALLRAPGTRISAGLLVLVFGVWTIAGPYSLHLVSH